MGKLQDSQYINHKVQQPQQPQQQQQEEEEEQTPQEKLQATFCPPLDSSLIEAIWNDTFDYQSSFEILAALAEEAEQALDEQDRVLESSYDLDDSTTTATTTLTTTTMSDATNNSEEDNIQFLLRCFPLLGLDELKEALITQDNDVEKATDILLSQQLIEDDDDEDEYFYVSSEKKKQEDDTFFTSMEKNKKKKKRNSKKAITTKQIIDASPLDDNGRIIDRISFYFPGILKKTIEQVVQRYNGHIIASVKRLMEKNPHVHPEEQFRDWAMMKAVIQVKDTLETVMVERTPDEIYRVAVATVIQEFDKNVHDMSQIAIEFFLTDIDDDGGDSCWTVIKSRRKSTTATVSAAAAASSSASSKEPGAMTFNTHLIQNNVNNFKEPPVLPDYLRIDNQHDYPDDDPKTCRETAMELILERNELFRKAAESYKRNKNKGPGETGAASFYSERARQLDEDARKWNMRAAKATVRQQRLKYNDDHLLDFHGLTVAEAKLMLVEGITQWWSRSQMRSSRSTIKPLKIITGVGNHSQGQQAKLLPMTLKYLKSQGWLYEMPNSGSIIVKSHA